MQSLSQKVHKHAWSAIFTNKAGFTSLLSQYTETLQSPSSIKKVMFMKVETNTFVIRDTYEILGDE